MQKESKSYLALFEIMQRMRLTASALYDKAKASNQTPEQISQALQPITEALNQTMKRKVDESLGEVVTAIKLLDHEAKKHEQDARFCMSKKQDVEQHKMALLYLLKEDMKAKNLTERMEDNFMITLVGDDLNLR